MCAASGAKNMPLQNLLHNHFRLSAEYRGLIAFALCSPAHHLKPRDVLPADMAQLDPRPRRLRKGLGIYHYGQLALFDT
jgi:hypothetical protein